MEKNSEIDHIRAKSSPSNDQKEAIESNARLLDSLYRLSFTADKLTAPQVDELINSLQRKEDEVKVLLGRISDVYKNGFSSEIFSSKVFQNKKPK